MNDRAADTASPSIYYIVKQCYYSIRIRQGGRI